MISFYMPTKVVYDHSVVQKNSSLFKMFGDNALIVTGKHSATKNGSLDDVITALKMEHINYFIFNEIMENPSLEILDDAKNKYIDKAISLVIGIGGGSPLDAAKGIAVLLSNPTKCARDLQAPNQFDSLPVIAIATTAGTGSETTPYAIFTDHDQKTKANFKSRVFPRYALLDPKYFKSMPLSILRSTAIDALSHILEGYLTVKANPVSDLLAEKSLEIWSRIKLPLITGKLSDEDFQNLILASSFAGMVISQTGTSLPHAFGYYLTYGNNIPHGNATACFIGELFSFHEDKQKINRSLGYLGFDTISDFKLYLKEIIGPIEIEKSKVDGYIERAFQNKTKLQNHPYPVSKEDIERFFYRSVKVLP